MKSEKNTEAVGMLIYFDDADALFPALSQEEKGDLFDALILFGKTGQEYQGKNDRVFMTFRLMASKIIRDQQRLANKREKYRQNRLGKNGTIDNNRQQSSTIDNDCKESAYNSNSNCNSISNSNCKDNKDTRNVNPDGLTDRSSSSSNPDDDIQKQIEEIIGYMDEQGFNYDDCQGKGGIRGLLGKYLRKEGRESGQIKNAVKLTVERDAAIYDTDNNVGYFIRCMEH